MSLKNLSAIAVILLLAACQKGIKNKEPETAGSYFSIIQFTQDQWSSYRGQPYTFLKIVTQNGKSDSSYISAFNVNWGDIFKPFFESDISDRKYIGHYDFSNFVDDITLTRNFYYEAKDDNLFTRKLQISADETSNKIRSIYIETQKSTRWREVTQKLFYSPLKVIQIQKFEKDIAGPTKRIQIEYRFL